jgi:hypothetical protein
VVQTEFEKPSRGLASAYLKSLKRKYENNTPTEFSVRTIPQIMDLCLINVSYDAFDPVVKFSTVRCL